MPIESVTAPAPGAYAKEATREPRQTMDADVFMSLLVTQLRNQDPSSPMDTNQMLAQTTQLAMMEKMSALAHTTEESFSLQMRIAAADLVGKEVSYTDKDGKTASGAVTGVSFAGSVPRVSIGKESIALDSILAVGDVPDPEEPVTPPTP